MTRNLFPSLKTPSALAALASAGLLLTGCQKEEIAVYRVPKVPPGAGSTTEPGMPHAAASHGAPRPHAHWESLPPGWSEQPAAGSRAATFAIEGKAGQHAEAAVIAFPGMGGTDLQFVNLWREQLGLGPLTDEELPKLVQPAIISGADGKLYDITAATTAGAEKPGDRIIVALHKQDGVSWFIKLTGSAALVDQQKPAFLGFLKTLKFHAGADEGDPTVAQKYPGRWREEVNADIISVLVHNKVRGFGQLVWRASRSDPGEYLVYCTADGETWVAYIVWFPSKKIMGPLKPDPSIPPPRAVTPSGPTPSEPTHPSWTAPAHWKQQAPGAMQAAKFGIGEGKAKAEVTAVFLGGMGGGLKANLDRWRAQLSLAPSAANEVDQQVKPFDALGSDARIVEIVGTTAQDGDPASMIVLLVPSGGGTWFYKLMGDKSVVAKEKDALIAFVKSAKP